MDFGRWTLFSLIRKILVWYLYDEWKPAKSTSAEPDLMQILCHLSPIMMINEGKYILLSVSYSNSFVSRLAWWSYVNTLKFLFFEKYEGKYIIKNGHSWKSFYVRHKKEGKTTPLKSKVLGKAQSMSWNIYFH